jgi:hypothetical protein
MVVIGSGDGYTPGLFLNGELNPTAYASRREAQAAVNAARDAYGKKNVELVRYVPVSGA